MDPVAVYQAQYQVESNDVDDIDFNGHVTNSRYTDFVMDCFPLEYHQPHSVKSMEINYLNEALPGDTFIIRKDTVMDSNLIYFEVLNAKDGKVVFKARVQFTS